MIKTRHTDRAENEGKNRKKLKNHELGCNFIRSKPDTEHYDICVEIGKIHNHINELTKK